MRITLCGSTRFAAAFKEWDKKLTHLGHTVYSLYEAGNTEREMPSDEAKVILDLVHLDKILNSDAILVLDLPGEEGKPYVGFSTRREVAWAAMKGKNVFRISNGSADQLLEYPAYE